MILILTDSDVLPRYLGTSRAKLNAHSYQPHIHDMILKSTTTYHMNGDYVKVITCRREPELSNLIFPDQRQQDEIGKLVNIKEVLK